MDKPPIWSQFLEHIGPYYWYVFHQETSIDLKRRVVTFLGGQGAQFEYSFERYRKKLRQS